MIGNDELQVWCDGLFQRFYIAVHERVDGNTDPRFDMDPTNHMFYIEPYASYAALFAVNLRSFWAAREILSDDESRECFDRVVLFRLLSHFHFRIAEASTLDWTAKTEVRERITDDPCLIENGPNRVSWRVREIEVGGEVFRMECPEGMLGYNFFGGQYEYTLGDADVRICPGDKVIDGGAYVGDTAIPFARAAGEFGKVYAFEPGVDHFKMLSWNVARHNPSLSGRIRINPCALGEIDNGDVGRNLTCGINPGARVVEGTLTHRLDGLIEDGAVLPDIDFVKLDVEGSEMAALRGMRDMLVRCRPRLAICVYHKPQDLFEIPLYLWQLLPFYRWYLAHHSIRIDETVLYGEPES
jgi:FkbM family methyltransferase